ncbi:hypothetical protein D3C78_885990 [compost metagenome]
MPSARSPVDPPRFPHRARTPAAIDIGWDGKDLRTGAPISGKKKAPDVTVGAFAPPGAYSQIRPCRASGISSRYCLPLMCTSSVWSPASK